MLKLTTTYSPASLTQQCLVSLVRSTRPATLSRAPMPLTLSLAQRLFGGLGGVGIRSSVPPVDDRGTRWSTVRRRRRWFGRWAVRMSSSTRKIRRTSETGRSKRARVVSALPLSRNYKTSRARSSFHLHHLLPTSAITLLERVELAIVSFIHLRSGETLQQSPDQVEEMYQAYTFVKALPCSLLSSRLRVMVHTCLHMLSLKTRESEAKHFDCS